MPILSRTLTVIADRNPRTHRNVPVHTKQIHVFFPGCQIKALVIVACCDSYLPTASTAYRTETRTSALRRSSEPSPVERRPGSVQTPEPAPSRGTRTPWYGFGQLRKEERHTRFKSTLLLLFSWVSLAMKTSKESEKEKEHLCAVGYFRDFVEITIIMQIKSQTVEMSVKMFYILWHFWIR